MATSASGLTEFRSEVRAWLRDNVAGVGAPVDPANLTREQYLRNREFHRKLGAKGWYAAGWPAEYGGGGLTIHHARIIQSELGTHVPHVENSGPLGDITGTAANGVWAFGTEEMKRTFLPPQLRAETVTWELYTEPEAGSDLPSLKTTAVRSGDDYIINGSKVFVGGQSDSDYLLVLAVTNPDRPRRHNLSAFLVPTDSPGITITPIQLIAWTRKHAITLDGVRVPAENRIGDEGVGWMVFTQEKAPRWLGPVGLPGHSGPSDRKSMRDLIDLYQRSPWLKSSPQAQQLRHVVTEAWIDDQVQRLLRERIRLMVAARAPMTYERSQAVMDLKEHNLRVGDTIERVLGPVANISGDPWALSGAELEYFQRYAIVSTHPGGTVEVQKIRVFREMAAKLGYGREERSHADDR